MSAQSNNLEIDMYIGGGILGLILVVALVLFVLRRA
jgi:O-antigen ligase